MPICKKGFIAGEVVHDSSKHLWLEHRPGDFLLFLHSFSQSTTSQGHITSQFTLLLIFKKKSPPYWSPCWTLLRPYWLCALLHHCYHTRNHKPFVVHMCSHLCSTIAVINLFSCKGLYRLLPFILETNRLSFDMLDNLAWSSTSQSG